MWFIIQCFCSFFLLYKYTLLAFILWIYFRCNFFFSPLRTQRMLQELVSCLCIKTSIFISLSKYLEIFQHIRSITNAQSSWFRFLFSLWISQTFIQIGKEERKMEMNKRISQWEAKKKRWKHEIKRQKLQKINAN